MMWPGLDRPERQPRKRALPVAQRTFILAKHGNQPRPFVTRHDLARSRLGQAETAVLRHDEQVGQFPYLSTFERDQFDQHDTGRVAIYLQQPGCVHAVRLAVGCHASRVALEQPIFQQVFAAPVSRLEVIELQHAEQQRLILACCTLDREATVGWLQRHGHFNRQVSTQ